MRIPLDKLCNLGSALAALLAAASLLLTGCETPDRDFGGVVQHNAAAHIVDLDPVYAGVPIEGGNGRRAGEAVARYYRGAVKSAAAGGNASNTGGANAPAAPAPTPK